MTNRSPDGALTAIDRAREAKGTARHSGRLEQYDTQLTARSGRCLASLSSGGAGVVPSLPARG